MRWQQGKRTAGPGAEAVDGAAVFDAAAVQVCLDLHRLADAHVTQLGFLEVGVDPQLIQGNHRHQRGTRLHALAKLYRTLGHVTGHRRNQGAAGVVQVGLTQLRGGGHHVRVR
ncbi:hypothetical protein D3C78_1602920 [compost metagenome]